MLTWSTIFDAIEAHLAAVENASSAPAFQSVVIGPPAALPLGGPHAFAWYKGRTDPLHTAGANKTLGNVMYAARIGIAAFWPWQPDRATHESWEADIATIDTNLRRAFRADATINSNVTDLEILDSADTEPYVQMPQLAPGGATSGIYRVLEMELVLDNLEGEAIAP